MNARSDTASTCSDTMEEQEDLEYPFQSGLSSFMTAFGADIQKHLNVRNTLKDLFPCWQGWPVNTGGGNSQW